MSALRACRAAPRRAADLQAAAEQLVAEEILHDVPAVEGGGHPQYHTDEPPSHMMILKDAPTSQNV